MERRLLALAATACFAATQAHAQSTVTLYGNVDSAVAYFSNVNGRPLYLNQDGNLVPDLFGLTGAEDLGGGLRAVFRLEAGYSLNSGKLVVPGQIFQRESSVGLKSDALGNLTFGHQPSFMYDTLSPYSTAYLGGGFSAFHQGNLDELANTFEFDNSVKYLSASYRGLSVGAQFGFGNHPGAFAAGRNYGFTLKYQIGSFSFGAAYANENDRYLEMASFIGLKSLFGAPLPGAQIVARNVENWGVGGSYALGSALLHVLFTQTRIAAPIGAGEGSSVANTVDTGVTYAFQTDTLGAGATVENFAGGHWVTVALSNAWQLSKRTSLYQQLMYQKATGANAVASMVGAGPASGGSQFGAAVGIQHFF
ncbi:porin [Paraburkholderia sp. J63]|uniref:porin n=1 Tax=Paraburkholderia sp. J63 TaxID=2805434 RepID=UPI002ABDB7AE|nr:porin [Paraburkholderia sp. J63]